MEFNLVTNLEVCYQAVKENPLLLYYSHIPTAIVSLIIGFFVYFKSKELIGKLLLIIGILFSIWTTLDLIIWTNFSSVNIMLVWSFLGLITGLLFFVCYYFTYVFLFNKDLGFIWKNILCFLILPLVVFTPTIFNLERFDSVNCEAVEGSYFTNYYYLLGPFFFLLILITAIFAYIKAEGNQKKKILLLSFGVELFLLTFFIAGYVASTTNNFEMEQYGLFGMTFFMGMLAFIIVKFKAFNIKLIGAQALVVSLVILVGSQFFFVQNNTAIVLTGVTLALSLGFGYMLVKSVKGEVKQREELEVANKEINERKEQLQLMADKLSQANDQLRKLDNAKTEFISIASHQLRTPITAIKGFASLVLEGSYGDISESIRGAMDKIYLSSERLVNLIEDLLNVSRIESGRMTFAFENSSVTKLIKELYDNFILIAKNKQFYLELKIAENIPEIKMDYVKIRELVSNFVDNALKYTEKGGVTIKAEVKDEGVIIDENGFVVPGKVSEYGKMVRITVSDTGIGIPKEEIPYLFKKFSRGKDVSRLHVGGTGLGLYVGKAIAEAHHGQVWVESDGAGKGSRFIIEIPVNA